jgi:hypothetical protein
MREERGLNGELCDAAVPLSDARMVHSDTESYEGADSSGIRCEFLDSRYIAFEDRELGR